MFNYSHKFRSVSIGTAKVAFQAHHEPGGVYVCRIGGKGRFIPVPFVK